MTKFLSLLILFTALFTNTANARQQKSDYMACSVIDAGSYVAITVVPQSYIAETGIEQAIIRRSCDTKIEQGGFGLATVFDCTKQLKEMNKLLKQLQRSQACPSEEEK